MPETDAEIPHSTRDLAIGSIPSEQIDIPLPASIGRYQVLKRLGRGGMGTVYLAIDPKLDREVAIKVPHPDQSGDPASRERFLREARAVAQFHHENFCPIFDIDQSETTPFLVMAYIKGRSLHELIVPNIPWDVRRAAETVQRLAVALAEAHRQGIVHRDLKPANVMVDVKERLILMDFGLARRFDSDDPTFTSPGAILGTPAYMSPEQADGETKAVGPQSDIYSLGVILYELLAGRRPFDGTVTRVLAQILMTEPLPPSSHNDQVDSKLESVCLKAMAKKVGDRYATMGEFSEAIGAWLHPVMSPQAVPGVTTTIETPTQKIKQTHVENHLPHKFFLMLSGSGFKLTVSIAGSLMILASGYLLTSKNSYKRGQMPPRSDIPFPSASIPEPLPPLAKEFPAGPKAETIPPTSTHVAPRSQGASVVAEPIDPRDAEILALLERPIHMYFAGGAPLGDVIKYVKESSVSESFPEGIPIYIDPSSLAEPGKLLQSNVIYYQAGVPLKTSLTLILEQVSLKYKVERGMLKITHR